MTRSSVIESDPSGRCADALGKSLAAKTHCRIMAPKVLSPKSKQQQDRKRSDRDGTTDERLFFVCCIIRAALQQWWIIG
jgi:hypothetical protein